MATQADRAEPLAGGDAAEATEEGVAELLLAQQAVEDRPQHAEDEAIHQDALLEGLERNAAQEEQRAASAQELQVESGKQMPNVASTSAQAPAATEDQAEETEDDDDEETGDGSVRIRKAVPARSSRKSLGPITSGIVIRPAVAGPAHHSGNQPRQGGRSLSATSAQQAAPQITKSTSVKEKNTELREAPNAFALRQSLESTDAVPKGRAAGPKGAATTKDPPRSAVPVSDRSSLRGTAVARDRTEDMLDDTPRSSRDDVQTGKPLPKDARADKGKQRLRDPDVIKESNSSRREHVQARPSAASSSSRDAYTRYDDFDREDPTADAPVRARGLQERDARPAHIAQRTATGQSKQNSFASIKRSSSTVQQSPNTSRRSNGSRDHGAAKQERSVDDAEAMARAKAHFLRELTKLQKDYGIAPRNLAFWLGPELDPLQARLQLEGALADMTQTYPVFERNTLVEILASVEGNWAVFEQEVARLSTKKRRRSTGVSSVSSKRSRLSR